MTTGNLNIVVRLAAKIVLQRPSPRALRVTNGGDMLSVRYGSVAGMRIIRSRRDSGAIP